MLFFTNVSIRNANDRRDSFVCFCSCCNTCFACCFDFSESNMSENSLQNTSNPVLFHLVEWSTTFELVLVEYVKLKLLFLLFIGDVLVG